MEGSEKPNLAGLAGYDFGLYYLVAQLSHFYHIDKFDKLRYLSLVCQPSESHLSHLFYDELRGLGGCPVFSLASCFTTGGSGYVQNELAHIV